MNRFAVMGHPIAHSRSPEIHKAFGQSCDIELEYQKLDVEPEHFEKFVKAFFEKGGKGLNITLPFKGKAFHLADKTTARATEAKSANTLWMEGDQLLADNTDGAGFIEDLMAHHIKIANKNILILGAGGAVRGILHPLLQQHPAKTILMNRTRERAKQLSSSCPQLEIKNWRQSPSAEIDILINGLSMVSSDEFPKVKCAKNGCYYDLKYGEIADEGCQWAKEQGFSQILDGSGMLLRQAALSFTIWNGVKPDLAKISSFN